ncbi:MAG: Asp23/Gls24 family envelope stress response protein [Clostridia bacterium]|nr:Asp23/Gls24 family envelope stress response protein [Clostridia bacterium]
MRVYALVGKSGTGKSHHSMMVAGEHQIDYIIDDGLLISNNKIIAGKSAKRATTKMESVRRAIFSDKNHIKAVREAIDENEVESILVIGTSDKMVNRIAEALEIGPVERIIRIEEVCTPDEIQMAVEMRNKHGKHVIPVPTFELKKQFSGYFTDPITLLFKKKGQMIEEEKTVMRPAYSYLGEYKISPKAIADICTYEAMCMPQIHKVLKIRSTTTVGGRLVLDIDVSMNFPCKVSKAAQEVSDRIKKAIEEYTSITVRHIHINVKSLEIK